MKRVLQPVRAIATALAVVAAVAVAGLPAVAATDPGPVPGAELDPNPQPVGTVGVGTTVAESDPIIIESNGFDVGGSGFSAGAPTDAAVVDWVVHDSGLYITPVVRGSIHFDDVASSCARVRLITYDGWDNQVSETYSDEECAYRDGHVERPFEITLSGGGMTEAKVTLQTLALNGTWGNLGSQTVTLGPTVDTDEVSISRAEFDLGSGPFIAGTAADPATVTWAIPAERRWADIYPTFTGTLYMNNADDLCGRVQAKYYYPDGSVWFTQTSDEHCVTDDDLHTFPVVMASDRQVFTDIKYSIQKKDNTGEWTTMGSMIVALG